ncbi:MAG: amidohydrolase family protein, partial [Chloroflexi bacterium]|nr:amidohydrolase family protein [Chloroflexota bacterium]
MQIVDAQVHIWEPSRPDRPWDVVLQPHGGGQFLAEQLLAAMDESGVDRAVLVPPTWLGYSNDYALEAAQRWPDRFAVMGRFDPSTPDAPARLTTWLDQPGMLGVRFVFHRSPLLELL